MWWKRCCQNFCKTDIKMLKPQNASFNSVYWNFKSRRKEFFFGQTNFFKIIRAVDSYIKSWCHNTFFQNLLVDISWKIVKQIVSWKKASISIFVCIRLATGKKFDEWSFQSRFPCWMILWFSKNFVPYFYMYWVFIFRNFFTAEILFH